MPPSVSLITVYYNTPNELLELYKTVTQFCSEENLEFIVADNSSEQDLSPELPHTVYLRLDKNYGFGAACNKAAQIAKASVLFFVNPDSLFSQNCIPALVSKLGSAGIVAPVVVNPDGTAQLSFGRFPSVFSEFVQKSLMRRERSEIVQNWLVKKTSQDFQSDYVSGCALMIRSDLFQEIGGFDENFFLYFEDVDLCKRVTEKGLRIKVISDARIVHLRNRSTSKNSKRTEEEYRRSQLYYYKKHRSRVHTLVLKLYLSLKYAFKSPMLKLIWSVGK